MTTSLLELLIAAKNHIGCYLWMLYLLLQNVCFRYNELIKQNKTKHLRYLFINRVKHPTIAAFIVLGLVA